MSLSEVQVGCKNEGNQRMALFYGGVRAFEDGDPATARQLWAQIKAPSYSQCEFEYYLLEHEKKKI